MGTTQQTANPLAPTVPSTPVTTVMMYNLIGTKITETGTGPLAVSAAVHRQSRETLHEYEMWYLRDAVWSQMPIPPLLSPENSPQLDVQYREAATMTISFLDGMGWLTPENLESPYNYNAANNYDALLDDARKVLWRAGIYCWGDLVQGKTPTSTLTPSGGALSTLTDDTYTDYSLLVPAPAPVTWAPGSATPFDILFDTGANQLIQHVAVRFGTKTAAYTLPSSIQILTSRDNATYTPYIVRPVGGSGSATVPPGDWIDDKYGSPVLVAICDLGVNARYVKIRVTPTGAQNIAIDNIHVYGGTTRSLLGRNLFVGYLGDDIQVDPSGLLTLKATDVTRKLSDNNEVRLTSSYQMQDVGDIAYSLLTANGYWKGQSAYNTPFASTEINWAYGSKLTNLTYPLYQGQSNSLYGYVSELFQSCGWVFYADQNGCLGAFNPPYDQRIPERVFIAAPDGNNDVWNCVRDRTGKDLRNTVEVTTGKVASGVGGSEVQWEPSSVARFGPRRTIITDPIAQTPEIRRSICTYVLRDYAWRLQTLQCTIQPDFDTYVRDIHGFRAPARPHLYARACSIAGNRRLGEMWSLTGITHTFTPSKWTGDCKYVPYHPQPVNAPAILGLTSSTATNPADLTVTWTVSNDPDLVTYNVYYSSVSDAGPFQVIHNVNPAPGTYLMNSGLISGQHYWVYMTSVDKDGNESIPSGILDCISSSGNTSYMSNWQVTDLVLSLLAPITGPDSSGYYTYQFQAIWTSPPAGFKRFQICANPDVIPQGANNRPDDSRNWQLIPPQWFWAGDYVPPTMTWDRVTPGQLTWSCNFRSKTNLTGHKLYFRMWTSWKTTKWEEYGANIGTHIVGYPGNITYVQL